MREPFIRHKRLHDSARRWRNARVQFATAKDDRYQAIEQARVDGYTLNQIAEAFGMTRRGIEIVLHKGREATTSRRNP